MDLRVPQVFGCFLGLETDDHFGMCERFDFSQQIQLEEAGPRRHRRTILILHELFAWHHVRRHVSFD